MTELNEIDGTRIWLRFDRHLHFRCQVTNVWILCFLRPTNGFRVGTGSLSSITLGCEDPMSVDMDYPSEPLRWRVLEAGEFLRIPSSRHHVDQLDRAHAAVTFIAIVNALGSLGAGCWWITILSWYRSTLCSSARSSCYATAPCSSPYGCDDCGT